MLTSDALGPAQVARVLVEQGYRSSEVTVLEQLGGPGELLRSGLAGNWSEPPGDPLAVVAVRCVPDPGTVALPSTPGLPDDVAFDHDGQLTKREVRAVTLARLGPVPGQLLWDVGGGAGSIAIEWLRAEESCRAIAIERDPTRAARIRHNAAALGVPVGAGGAGDRCGTGGAGRVCSHPGRGVRRRRRWHGGGHAGNLLDRVASGRAAGGPNAVIAAGRRGETARRGLSADHGGSLTRIAIQRAAPVGARTGWRPAMPVTQWVGDKP